MKISGKLVVVKSPSGGYSCDKYTPERLNTLLSFCVTPGTHQFDDGTTRSQMIRFISACDGYLTVEVMEYDYDPEKGIFIGEHYWKFKDVIKQKDLEMLYTHIVKTISDKNYYHQVGINLLRTKDERLEIGRASCRVRV